MKQREIEELINLVKDAKASIPTTAVEAQEKDAKVIFQKIKNLGHVLCEGNDVNPQIKNIIPISERGEFCNSVLALTHLNVFSINKAPSIINQASAIINSLSKLLKTNSQKKAYNILLLGIRSSKQD